jgi:hypothetical protein
MSFEALGQVIDGGLAAASTPEQDPVLVEEVRVTCTQAMLLSLDREHRLAYVLGEILELSGDEGALVLEITPEAFRKRLSRARSVLLDFMKGRCGVLDEKNPCRCTLQVPYARRTGMLDPNALRFSNHPRRDKGMGEVIGLLSAAAVFRTHPDYVAPDKFVSALKHLLQDA